MVNLNLVPTKCRVLLVLKENGAMWTSDISEKIFEQKVVPNTNRWKWVIRFYLLEMQINGMVKNMYDRFFPLMGNEGAPRYGAKQIVTVYTQEMDDPHMHDSYFDFLAGTLFPSFGLQEVHRMVCMNANNPETAENNEELKREAYEVGRRLAAED